MILDFARLNASLTNVQIQEKILERWPGTQLTEAPPLLDFITDHPLLNGLGRLITDIRGYNLRSIQKNNFPCSLQIRIKFSYRCGHFSMAR
jgi:hypothetical protein